MSMDAVVPVAQLDVDAAFFTSRVRFDHLPHLVREQGASLRHVLPLTDVGFHRLEVDVDARGLRQLGAKGFSRERSWRATRIRASCRGQLRVHRQMQRSIALAFDGDVVAGHARRHCARRRRGSVRPGRLARDWPSTRTVRSSCGKAARAARLTSSTSLPAASSESIRRRGDARVAKRFGPNGAPAPSAPHERRDACDRCAKLLLGAAAARSIRISPDRQAISPAAGR